MQRELTKAEVERLFLGAVDDALDSSDAEAFRQVLARDPELTVRFEKYAGAVQALKGLPREKAPPALASMILRRTRRRRSFFRRNAAHEADYRLPVEVIVPLLVAAVVALFLLLATR